MVFFFFFVVERERGKKKTNLCGASTTASTRVAAMEAGLEVGIGADLLLRGITAVRGAVAALAALVLVTSTGGAGLGGLNLKGGGDDLGGDVEGGAAERKERGVRGDYNGEYSVGWVGE